VADDFKYHIDHHASLVPPVELTDARAATGRGDLTPEALHEVENLAIADALLTQRRLGLSALSDGEFHRRTSLSPVFDGIEGFGPSGYSSPMAWLVGDRHAPEVRALLSRPAARGRLLKEESSSLASATERATMLAVPSPGFLAELSAPDEFAPSWGLDLAEILRAEITAVASDGVRHVVARNPAYGHLLRSSGRARARRAGLDPDIVLARMMTADASLLDGLDAPADFRLSLDLTTAGSLEGDYDPAAIRAFSSAQPYSRICVEYPQQPSERFPIGELTAGTVVSLGVVDISRSEIESVDALVSRIDEATAVIDVDDIAVSTNGGFHATRAIGTQTEAWAKLQVVEMVARYFWGNEL
jgi:5-methyltetrahydropteroyltriglutamate--homocysteine methyltransferase